MELCKVFFNWELCKVFFNWELCKVFLFLELCKVFGSYVKYFRVGMSRVFGVIAEGVFPHIQLKNPFVAPVYIRGEVGIKGWA